MIINASKIAIGKLITMINEERKWNKKTTQIRETTINSSINLSLKVLIARWIKLERS